MNIRGTEGLSPADLQAEIARGARFVVYQWCVSLLIVTLKRGSRVYFHKPGDSGFGPGFLWSAVSLVGGWWGIPWGPIYTIGSLWTNSRGGIDVTAAVAGDLAATHGAPAVPPLVGAPTAGPRWSAGPLAALGVFAAAIAATISGTHYYAAQHRPCALVNGLDTAYSIQLDNTTRTLAPHSVAKIELPEGPHTVVAMLPDGAGETRFTFSAGRDAVVVNPDTAALVTEETTFYTTEAKPTAKNPDPKIHCGRESYTLRAPDFFIDEFPDKISMPKNESRTARTRVGVYPDIALNQLVGIVQRSAGRPACVAYLKSLGAHLPHNQVVLATACQVLEPAEAKEFFAENLKVRPVLVEWHRAYQNYLQYRQPETDLLAEYRQLAEADPDDGALAYLYGRILDDPQQDAVWFQRALEAKRPCPQAHAALAYAVASRGDFAAALRHLDRARSAGLDSAQSRGQRLDCLLALGRIDDALREFKAQPAGAAVDFSRSLAELHLAFLAGGKPAARQVIEATLARLPAGARQESGAAVRKAFELQIAYYEGNVTAYAANFNDDDSGPDRLIGALCRGEVAAAEKVLATLPTQSSRSWLMLFLAARLHGDRNADAYWRNSVAAFAREPGGRRRLAAHFAGTARLSPDELVDFPMDADDKRLFLAALGLREPALRAACFARAKLCNFDRGFPHHLVAGALATAQP